MTAVALAEGDRHIERGLAQHAFDQLALGRGQLRRDDREAGALAVVRAKRREGCLLAWPLFDQGQLEAAPPQHAPHVAQHA